MSEKLKGKEVWRALLDGKKIRNIKWRKGFWLKMSEDGAIQDSDGYDYMEAPLSIPVSEEYEIYEDPQDERLIKRVEEISIRESLDYKQFVLTMEAKSLWCDALETFMKLKYHPLARKAIDNKRQYTLGFSKETGLYIEDWLSDQLKLDLLSPVFNSQENAQQAINDIGKENIIQMFKVLGGCA